MAQVRHQKLYNTNMKTTRQSIDSTPSVFSNDKIAHRSSKAAFCKYAKHTVGLAPYTCNLVKDLVVFRLLKIYGPYLPEETIPAKEFYASSGHLSNINASRLQKFFHREVKLRRMQNSTLAKFLRALDDKSELRAVQFEQLSDAAEVCGFPEITQLSSAIDVLAGHQKYPGGVDPAKGCNNIDTLVLQNNWDALSRTLAFDMKALETKNSGIIRILRSFEEDRDGKDFKGLAGDLWQAMLDVKEKYFKQLRCQRTFGTDINVIKYTLKQTWDAKLNHGDITMWKVTKGWTRHSSEEESCHRK